jgi:putative ABC transport system substrate-binding protein
MFYMRRREFITLIGGAAAGSSLLWPLAARAQQPDGVRRVGVLMGFAESDTEWQARLTAFRTALQGFGWTDGRNLRFDIRWTAGDPNRTRASAAELAASAPDVILASPHFVVLAMHQQTRTIPIVAIQSGDPVDAGFVQSYARPGGNVTAFLLFEATINAKFLQLLKEIAPHLARVAVLQSESSSWRGDFRAVEAAARSLAVKPTAMIVRDAADIERAIVTFAGEPNGGLILPPDAMTIRHRDVIIALAAKHRLTAVYSGREFMSSDGLMFYGADFTDVFRRSASYVDRILRGANPGELSVQAPTKFELVLNLKAAKALGLDVPPTLLIRADEVIE